MKVGVAILVGVVASSLLAYGAFKLMVNMIPAGQPIARAMEPFNDPNDLTPREPVLPKGPHRELFMDNCTVCHSTRLAMTQPAFPTTKWTEVVKKMVTVYGAKIDPPMEAQIVEYLANVKGVK